MKRLFSIFVIFALFVCNYSQVFAEEISQEETTTTETSNEIISFDSKHPHLIDMDDYINKCGLSHVTIRYFDREWKAYKQQKITFTDEDYTENVMLYLTFMEQFFDILTDDKSYTYMDESEYIEKYGESSDMGRMLEINTKYAKNYPGYPSSSRLAVDGNKLRSSNRYAYVSNPNEAIDFVLEYIESGNLKDLMLKYEKDDESHIAYNNFQYDPVNYRKLGTENKAYRLQDKLEFDIVPDESYYDTFFEEIGDLGETVHVTIENIWVGHPFFLLTFEGSEGEKTFWHHNQDVWSFGGNTGNGLDFSLGEYPIGNDMYYENIMYKSGDEYWYTLVVPTISLRGEVTDGNISKITMKMSFGGLEPTNTVSTTSGFDYQYYGNEKQYRLDQKVLLPRIFGVSKATEIKLNRQQGENALEQDVENWKTDLRYEDDEVEFDFSVSYAAKVRLNDISGNIPTWLKLLGTRPELTIIGLNTTCNGKENINYPILSFNGNGKTKWFAMSKMEDSQTNSALDDSTIYVKFNSMTSFENFVKIENLESYDSIGMYLHYNMAGDVAELGSIDIVIDDKTITVTAEEIDSILGGDKVYENWL